MKRGINRDQAPFSSQENKCAPAGNVTKVLEHHRTQHSAGVVLKTNTVLRVVIPGVLSAVPELDEKLVGKFLEVRKHNCEAFVHSFRKHPSLQRRAQPSSDASLQWNLLLASCPKRSILPRVYSGTGLIRAPFLTRTMSKSLDINGVRREGSDVVLIVAAKAA